MDYTRLFSITSTTSSSVGMPGYDNERAWTKFFNKYRDGCLIVLKDKYPYWAADAEDAFMMATAQIRASHGVSSRDPSDHFRTILCNICVKQMRILHTVHREQAKRTFAKRLLAMIQPDRAPRDTARRERIKEIIAFIRNDLLNPDSDNRPFRCPIYHRHLSLWRFMQQSDTTMTQLAKDLGCSLRELKYAKSKVDKWIVSESTRIAKELHYLD